ncbi:hypothetical protein HG530_002039 [Fusarium avenaceum]|nr:hypothetical protein HG530_002039 [Fusarium avenaceum]
MSAEQEQRETTVISSSEDEGLIVVNDLTLTADDLPLGEHEEEDRQSATRICELLNEHGKSMPRSVRDKIIKMLKDGIFHHTTASKIRPSKHQLCQKMWDSEFKSPNRIHITYENWFILSGVYDQKKLSESTGGNGIMKALQRRYGYDPSTSLAYRNGPLNVGLHEREFMTQISSIVLKHEEKFAKQELDNEKLKLEKEKRDLDIEKLKLDNEKLHDRVRAVELEIKTLRDQVEAGSLAANDGSDRVDYYDDMFGY